MSADYNSERPVILACLPWAAVDLPSLQLGILAARLRIAGIGVHVCHLNLDFAEMVGTQAYGSYSSFHNDLADWAFARDLYPEYPNDEAIFALAREEGVSSIQINEARRLAVTTGRFLDHCMVRIDWASARIVGLTTSLLQTLPALALARRLAAAHPHLTILLGGSGCAGSMGEVLHRNFPFVDGVVRGDADATIVPLVKSVLREAAPPRIPGLIWRRADGQSYTVSQAALADLSDYPVPDYDDYFQEMATRPSLALSTKIPFEGSRGCWWGSRRPCLFCGLNGPQRSARSRRVQAVVEELTAQHKRYGVDCFVAADNLMPTSHLMKLPSALPLGLANSTFFFEVRPDVHRGVLAGLARMGNVHIQSGIESLLPQVLELSGKGSFVLGGICLLRRARELGLKVHWNFMCGFPSERLEWYEDLMPRLPALFHLEAPDIVPMSLQRHSAYFESPEQFGIKVLGPRPASRLVWRLPNDQLRDLCFSLNFDAPGRSNLPVIERMLRDIAADWKALQSSLTVSLRQSGHASVEDRRSPGRTYLLPLAWTDVLRCLEGPASIDDIAARLRRNVRGRYLALGGGLGIGVAISELEARGLVWCHQDSAVALPTAEDDAFWFNAVVEGEGSG